MWQSLPRRGCAPNPTRPLVGPHRPTPRSRGAHVRASLRRGYAPNPPRPRVGPHRPTPRSRGAHVRALARAVAIGVLLSLAVSAGAQTVTRGEVTDESGNGLAGVAVLAEATGGGGSQTTMTDEDGRFMFNGLSSAEWSFTATLDGYQGVRGIVTIRRTNNRPVEFELPWLTIGGVFRERTDFEAEGGIPKFRFEEDHTFEFEDDEGEGEGNYGIVDQTAVLIVRDYDGPDDRFNVNTPVVVEFADEQFSSMTHAGVQIPKKP